MQDKKRGSSRGRSPSRRRPPFGKVDHQITHAQARRMRKRFLALFGSELDFGAPLLYGRDIFDRILKQEGVVGIRFYPGIGDDGKYVQIFNGVDQYGNDVQKGIIGDTPLRCPPWCSDANGVTEF